MKLRQLARGETWMTEAEAETARALVNACVRLFRDRSIAEHPLLTLRVNDLVVSLIVARRLEGQLGPSAAETEKGPPALATTAEAVGKARERMRKAMKELEDACAKLGTPIDQGLAGVMQPIIQKVNAIATEQDNPAEE